MNQVFVVVKLHKIKIGPENLVSMFFSDPYPAYRLKTSPKYQNPVLTFHLALLGIFMREFLHYYIAFLLLLVVIVLPLSTRLFEGLTF